MKKSVKFLSLALIVMFAVTAFKPAKIGNNGIEVGATIAKADLKMKDVSGKEISLNEMKGENGLLVIFIANNCPFVKLNEMEILERAAHAGTRNIGVVFVNSNEAQRNGDDSFEAMQKYSIQHKIKDYHYVVDKNSELANAFGATLTPQCFLFDKNTLVYKGALSNDPGASFNNRENYLLNAIASVLEHKVVKVSSTEAKGATIKSKE